MNRKIKMWSFICIAITFAMVFPNHIESLEPKYPTLRELIENPVFDSYTYKSPSKILINSAFFGNLK